MTSETETLPQGALAAATILDEIDDGVCALDRQLIITYANAAAGRLFGRAPSELIGRPADEELPSAAGIELRRVLTDALQDGGTRTFDYPSGSTELIVNPAAEGVWLRFRDVRARRAMEQQLRERDDILTMAERSAGIGVWDIDLASGMVRGTAQFWRIMGLPVIDHAVSIETTRALRLPDDREQVARGFQEIVGNHAESFEMEYRIRRPADGEIRWIFGRGRLIRDTNGRAVRYSGVDIDVTERKRAETVLADINKVLEQRVQERSAELEAEMALRAEAEARLRQAQKMETIGQLTGGIAHDFNNLLTVISGNVEALERRLHDEDLNLRRLAEAALRGTERAAQLTNRLLAFARRQTLEPKLIDVNQLVLGMSDLLHRTLGERISVRLSLAEGLPAVSADVNQLENAILNLAVNSHDAMPEGGSLSIETALAGEVESRPAEITDKATMFVRITVGDTGSGMTPDVLDMAFEPFFTTKQAGQGTGLGLSQVYGFIKQSGGYCRLDSEPDRGTSIHVYLPSAQRGELSVPADADTLPALARGSGETVLVTEDDPEVRAYTAELLSELGYAVLTADDAAQALQVLATDPKIALLFTDLGLPGAMNGRQLAETAIARNPRLKVLLTTGYSSDAIVRRGWRDPGMELIPKPFTSAALSAKIRQVLRG
jgi:PAS domain S-box-containing protein